MDVGEYLDQDEQIIAQARLHEDPYALIFSGEGGLITCTENRVVHIDGKNVVDFSINRVDSFEYRAPKMPKAYLYAGVFSLLFAIFGREAYPGLSTLGFVVGPVLLVTGYWLRTSTLEVHTPSHSYKFQSRDDTLVEIVHALRNREMD